VQPLVQIFSRGFTGGMYGGRAGRSYVTRDQPDNLGVVLGTVVGRQGGELLVDVSAPLSVGDGVGFEPPVGERGHEHGLHRLRGAHGGHTRRHRAPGARRARARAGRLARGAQLRGGAAERARASYAALPVSARLRKTRIDVRLFGAAGAPLKVVFTTADESVTVRSEIPLAPASKRAPRPQPAREQLGRLGDTPFALGSIDDGRALGGALSPGQRAEPTPPAGRRRAAGAPRLGRSASLAEREERVGAAVARVDRLAPAGRASGERRSVRAPRLGVLAGRRAHGRRSRSHRDRARPVPADPTPPVTRVLALRDELRERGVALGSARRPSSARASARTVDKWLALDLPVLSGHLGLVAELAEGGRDVVADYAVNAFNQHTAAELFRLGARTITASVELTVEEIASVAAAVGGDGFDVMVYGRPEGMTIEHCVLSAAFDRTPTTCRDLCVQKHANVQLTDPAGYTFAVATDSACRNRLLHSRPVEASEYLPRLWRAGIRGYQLLFNVPGDRIADIVAAYRASLDALAAGGRADLGAVRATVDGVFTRGHFARAV
jgi:putative protease